MDTKIILLIDDNEEHLKKIRTELRKRLPKRYRIYTHQYADEALRKLQDDPNIQFVVADWLLDDPRIEGKEQYYTRGMLINEIHRVRPNVALCVLTVTPEPPEEEGVSYGPYFCKENVDYDGLAAVIKREMEELKSAPFFEALRKYSDEFEDAWHTPGHSGGDSFRRSGVGTVKNFYSFFGRNYFRTDLSVSVGRLDSLLEPHGVIAQAQELAAKTFGSSRTFFCTNGTSTANKIVMQTLLNPGDIVLLDRNCHKSVHYGAALCDAFPVYLPPSLNEKYALMGPVRKAVIENAIAKLQGRGLRPKLLVLTNCTYDGIVYDLPYIVDLAHRNNVKVLVDEAWFGHAYFCPMLRKYSAMPADADYSTQSTHKVLSAFSQASMIHVRDKDFDEGRFHEFFMLHTSTSPQYTMVASLDCARLQMYSEGSSLVKKMVKASDELRKQINKLRGFRVLSSDDLVPPALGTDSVSLDPSKLTICFDESGYTRKALLHRLSEFHIEVEKSSFNTFTMLVTPGIALNRDKRGRFVNALRQLAEKPGGNPRPEVPPIPQAFALPPFWPRDVLLAETELVPIDQAVNENRVSARMVVPYPPGIPLLLPGQAWERDCASYVNDLRRHDVEVHGIDSEAAKVPVIKDIRELRRRESALDEGLLMELSNG